MTVHELIGMQYAPFEYIEDLQAIVDKNEEYQMIAVHAFIYGMIQGKRQERARRKR